MSSGTLVKPQYSSALSSVAQPNQSELVAAGYSFGLLHELAQGSDRFCDSFAPEGRLQTRLPKELDVCPTSERSWGAYCYLATISRPILLHF